MTRVRRWKKLTDRISASLVSNSSAQLKIYAAMLRASSWKGTRVHLGLLLPGFLPHLSSDPTIYRDRFGCAHPSAVHLWAAGVWVEALLSILMGLGEDLPHVNCRWSSARLFRWIAMSLNSHGPPRPNQAANRSADTLVAMNRD